MLTAILKETAGAALYHTGLLRALPGLPSYRGIKILAWHRVNDDADPIGGMSVSIENFRRQMKYLKEECDVLALERAMDLLFAGDRLPENGVVVTFDDGYRDNYENAFPALKNYGIPATIFLCAGAVQNGVALWFDSIAEAVMSSVNDKIDLSKYGLPVLDAGSQYGKTAAVGAILAFLKNSSSSMRTEILEALRKHSGRPAAKRAMLSPDEIRLMSGDGIEFGSHGMNHCILSHLADDEMEYEISQSAGVIEKITGKPVKYFAYPNGGARDYDARSAALLARYGYRAAFTLEKGANSNAARRFAMKRIAVTRGMESNFRGYFSRAIFASELAGVFQAMRVKE
ncbi:MAG: hypothetical protein A2293_14995 [Elusimicrobia bacterium RIFOXYB2_FULL_49_7]|nr:MAG: hypothetical protein A2293_14995 [Elusimicrobia bacterium RIFOXYB2_FULL_49_7]